MNDRPNIGDHNLPWFAEIVAGNPLMPVGIDPAFLISLLITVLPMLLKQCQKRKPDGDKIQKLAADMLSAGKIKPPPKIRRRLRKEGIEDEDQQNRIYLACLVQAAATRPEVLDEVAMTCNWTLVLES